MPKETYVIGYSGHSFVVCDIFLSNNLQPVGYFENEAKQFNPYNLPYYGKEVTDSGLNMLRQANYFVAIGSNLIRQKITQKIINKINIQPVNAIHVNAFVSSTATLGKGIMIGNGVTINACVQLDDGVICNTQCIIEHECQIESFSHIAPGAVLCGNVKVGKNTFIGARTVIKQGVTIGDNVIVGAGTVILKDIPDNSKVVGNPQKFI